MLTGPIQARRRNGLVPVFCRFRPLCLHPAVAWWSHVGRIGVALGWLWGGFGVALGWLWGGFGVALGWLSPGYQHALRSHAGGFRVAWGVHS